MLRRTLLLSIAAVLACVSPADAQSRGKAKSRRKGEAKVLKAGDEVVVAILGDEQSRNPKTYRAGVVNSAALTLPTYRRMFAPPGDPDYYFDRQTVERFIGAVATGDRAGIDQLVGEGRAVRVSAGTRAVVLLRAPDIVDSAAYLPTAPGGECFARILDGPGKDKLVDIPVRNLREPPK